MDDRRQPRPESADLTTLHVRGACRGDRDSRAWVVEHFSPALLLQARHRLHGPVSRYMDPEDLVGEVWAIALPRLPGLVQRDGRWTPVLVKFLSSTLLNRLRTIVRGQMRRERNARDAEEMGLCGGVPEEVSGIVTRLGRKESCSRLHECLESLSPRDRELVVLRGIEQIPNAQVAEFLGLSPEAVSVAYGRALGRLREAFPHSVFGELSEEF